tara:strand:+ start:456 stop:587 length:132 start_codon:yes stop_codon:yes gene_type:complete
MQKKIPQKNFTKNYVIVFIPLLLVGGRGLFWDWDFWNWLSLTF